MGREHQGETLKPTDYQERLTKGPLLSPSLCWYGDSGQQIANQPAIYSPGDQEAAATRKASIWGEICRDSQPREPRNPNSSDNLSYVLLRHQLPFLATTSWGLGNTSLPPSHQKQAEPLNKIKEKVELAEELAWGIIFQQDVISQWKLIS